MFALLGGEQPCAGSAWRSRDTSSRQDRSSAASNSVAQVYGLVGVHGCRSMSHHTSEFTEVWVRGRLWCAAGAATSIGDTAYANKYGKRGHCCICDVGICHAQSWLPRTRIANIQRHWIPARALPAIMWPGLPRVRWFCCMQCWVGSHLLHMRFAPDVCRQPTAFRGRHGEGVVGSWVHRSLCCFLCHFSSMTWLRYS